MRKETARRGLNPDKGFASVEPVTAERIGVETTTDVRHIFKNCTAYRLGKPVRKERRGAREVVQPGN